MPFGLVLGLCFFTFKIIGFDFSYFPGDLGDGRLNLYFLEHAHKFFTGKIPSFWEAPFMYPEPNVTAYSDNLLGSAPIYSFFRAIGVNTYLAYQLWFIVVSSLNYVCAFILLKYLFKNNYAAVLGALIFAFSIALQSQYTHAQTFPRYAIPLAILMAVKFSYELKPKYFFYALLFLVYQIYCGIYLGFFLVIPLGIYLILAFLKFIFPSEKKVVNLNWWFKIIASVIVNVLILLPLMLPYMERKIAPGFDHFIRISETIPTLTSYLFSYEGSIVWGFLSEIGQHKNAWWDHQLFPGAIAIISLVMCFGWLIIKLIKAKFRLSSISNPWLLTLAGAITLFLFLRFDDITAYVLLYYLPGFSALRSLTRVINIELIFFAIATALLFSKLFKQKQKYSFLIFLLGTTLIIIDNYSDKSYRTEVSTAQKRTNEVEDTFATIPKGSLVSYEPTTMTSSSIYYQIDAMLLSQKYNLVTLNGYTATCPGDYGPYWNKPNPETRNHWLTGKELLKDTLFYINGKRLIKKIETKRLGDSFLKRKDKNLLDLINYIKTDAEWIQQVKNKANQKNISLDSMLILDAEWMIENQN